MRYVSLFSHATEQIINNLIQEHLSVEFTVMLMIRSFL